jgi:hypothetical protein
MAPIAVLVLAGLGLLVGLAQAQVTSEESIGIVTAVRGGATVDHPDPSSGPVPLKLHDEMLFHDVIETQNESRTKTLFQDDSILTVGENSRIEITEHIYDPSQNRRSTVVKLVRGKLRALVSKVFRGAGSRFEIHTPSAVAAARGTYFVVWVEGVQSGIVNIGHSGLVDFTSGGQTVTVKPGQFSSARAGAGPISPALISSTAPAIVHSSVSGTDLREGPKPESAANAVRATLGGGNQGVQEIPASQSSKGQEKSQDKSQEKGKDGQKTSQGKANEESNSGQGNGNGQGNANGQGNGQGNGNGGLNGNVGGQGQAQINRLGSLGVGIKKGGPFENGGPTVSGNSGQVLGPLEIPALVSNGGSGSEGHSQTTQVPSQGVGAKLLGQIEPVTVSSGAGMPKEAGVTSRIVAVSSPNRGASLLGPIEPVVPNNPIVAEGAAPGGNATVTLRGSTAPVEPILRPAGGGKVGSQSLKPSPVEPLELLAVSPKGNVAVTGSAKKPARGK